MRRYTVIVNLRATTCDATQMFRVQAGLFGDRRVRASLRLLFVVVPLVGCSAGHDESATRRVAANLAMNTPAIHVRQTSVLLHKGKPAVERTYREALANCSGSVTSLADDVVAKLGRTYFETWYEGPRMVVQADRWDFKNADSAAGCHFEPVHESTLTIIAPGAATTVDLMTESAIRKDSHGVVREVTTLNTKAAKDAVDEDAKLRAAVMVELYKSGQSDLVAQDAGSATVAGQPCLTSKNPQEESCVWSGGAKWGFVTDTSAATDRMDAPVDNIPLSVKPVNGEGYRMTTESMSVGTPIEDNVFELPANIAIKPAG